MKNIKKKGFTLIELLVVITIISLLSSIVLSGMRDAREKSRDSVRVRSLNEIVSALQLYATDNGGFPAIIHTPLSNTLKDYLTMGDKKYISYINPEIYYTAFNKDGSLCAPPIKQVTEKCFGYHIAIPLERRDSLVLKNDSDIILPNNPPHSAYTIAGATDNCKSVGKSGDPELCYDINVF